MTDIERLLERLQGWARSSGIVRRWELSGRPEAPEIPLIALAEVSSEGRPAGGSGVGRTPAAALVGALGEAIERYAAAQVVPGRISRCALAALRDIEAVRPVDIAHYTAAQFADEAFPYVQVDDRSAVAWISGRWAADDSEVAVPALAALFTADPELGQPFGESTSNGLAAGSSRDDGALRAIAELVERDAFMMTWLTQRPGRTVDLTQILPEDRVLVELCSMGADVEVHVLESAGPFTVAMCVAFGDGERWPGATVGLGCDVDPISAIERAVLEQYQVGSHLSAVLRAKACLVPRGPDDILTPTGHAHYYFPPERRRAFDFLKASEKWSQPERPASRPALNEVAIHLADGGVRIALVDLTPPDLASCPLRVVRAISPDLQPIYFGENQRRVHRARLERAGTQSANANPHPLA